MGQPLSSLVEASAQALSPSLLRVARYFAANREAVLVSSAAELAEKLGTSDATVVRTAKALGFEGLDTLRRDLAEELKEAATPAERVARTLEAVKGDVTTAYEATLAAHLEAIRHLRRAVTTSSVRDTIRLITKADRVVVFGIGPSSAMAGYFATQGRRLGLDMLALTETGLLLADALLRLKRGDVLLIMAYSRVYPELRAIFDHADQLAIPRILMTDTLGAKLGKRSDLVLSIPRGRADRFSLHTATLAFIEALLVSIAAQRPQAAIDSLTSLNRLREAVAGRSLDL